MTDLATALEAVHADQLASQPPAPDPVTVDPNDQTSLARTGDLFHAWMEGSDAWDGWAMYTDLDTAMKVAAVAYADEEYPYRDEPDDEGCSKPGQLVWTKVYGSWHLADGGRDTRIRITLTAVYGPNA
jgi:hypothetical protein